MIWLIVAKTYCNGENVSVRFSHPKHFTAKCIFDSFFAQDLSSSLSGGFLHIVAAFAQLSFWFCLFEPHDSDDTCTTAVEANREKFSTSPSEGTERKEANSYQRWCNSIILLTLMEFNSFDRLAVSLRSNVICMNCMISTVWIGSFNCYLIVQTSSHNDMITCTTSTTISRVKIIKNPVKTQSKLGWNHRKQGWNDRYTRVDELWCARCARST